MRELAIAYGNSCHAKFWTNKTIAWEKLCERLSVTLRTTESVEEYKKMKKADRQAAKDKGGFVGGHIKVNRRKSENIAFRSMLTLDADNTKAGFIEEYLGKMQYASCLYTTHGHTPESPRVRIIVPLARDVSPDEYVAISRYFAMGFGIDNFDEVSYSPAQLMYWPTSPANAEFVYKESQGDWLDPDALLTLHPNWKDCSLLPTSSKESVVRERAQKCQEDPLKKSGIVGAFCRAYSIENAIDTFLSDIYAPSEMNGRYDYVLADSAAGVVLYDGKFAYSHHATDPTCGKLLNAFDIVRIHKFGVLDDKISDTSQSKTPSYSAMCDFAANDEKVRAVLAEDRAKQAKEEFTDEDWQKKLELDKAGNIKDTLSNISTIIKHDKNLTPIVFNQFKNMIDVIGELPWHQVKPGWSDTDLACAKLYFERRYRLWSPTKFKDALLAVTSADRLYHPIKDYLTTLKWDGIPRAETLLIDYLGAQDTPYVRAVTRKTLVAAIARIYRPGAKFDSILVLNGVQGVGKSTLFSKLGGKWFSDSLSISDMKDKTAPEKLQGYWILELSELNGIKKVDVEVVKSFITRTDDKFRQAYGVSVESHPRSCIIVGTTNSDGGFLRDITGNRRFWPVQVTGKGRYHPWELTEVDQVWAEAIEMFNRGEELFLKDSIAVEAYAQQRDAMETDAREGIVQEYLDRLLPTEWDKMDIYQRRNFLDGTEFGGETHEGTVQRNRICTMEIWCECFGKSRESMKKADAYEIESILYKLGNWVKYSGNANGKLRIPGYGVQKAYTRVADDIPS